MFAATVSEKGQVVIPAALRQTLGIKAGTALEFHLDGQALQVKLRHQVAPSAIEQGYGMLKTKTKGAAKRKLEEFDVAQAMRQRTAP